MNKDTQLKTQLVNEYATKGIKFVDEKMGEVKNLLDKYVNAIDEKGVITATGDPVFGENASDAMAKATELTVDYAALREVKASLDTAEKYKKLAEQKETDGDVLNPAGNTLDEKLLASFQSMTGMKDKLDVKTAIRNAVDEGRFDVNFNQAHKSTSCDFNVSVDERYRMLLNVFDHSDYASELLRNGRIQVAPIVQYDLLDIIPRTQLPVGGFKWMEEVSATGTTSPANAVAGRVEGGRVAEQNLSYVERTLTLKNAGVRLPITDEVSNDESFLVSFTSGRLEQNLRKYVGRQVYLGDGTGTNFHGFRSHVENSQLAGANATRNGFHADNLGDIETGQTAQANIPAYRCASNTDASVVITDLYKAATRIEDVGGEMPDYVALKSSTAASIVTARDANNNFVFPQNNFGMQMIPLLGLPFVKESNLADGTALIGSFARNCTLGVAGGLTAGIGYDGTDFSQFMRTMRLGFRGNLAVYNPHAFVLVYNVIN